MNMGVPVQPPIPSVHPFLQLLLHQQRQQQEQQHAQIIAAASVFFFTSSSFPKRLIPREVACNTATTITIRRG